MVTQLKSTFRRPLSAILLILLLGAVSFGFVSRMVEYLVVSEAVEETSKYYRSIGYLDTGDNDNDDVTEGARFLADCPLIDINNVVRFCSGTVDGIYNADLDGFMSKFAESNTSEALFWGELLDISYQSANENSSQDIYTFRFYVTEHIYGYPEYAPKDSYITVSYSPTETDPSFSDFFENLKLNTSYCVKAYYDCKNSYNAGMVLRRAVPDGEWMLSKDEAEKVEMLVDADAVQEINRHRIDLIGTKDMSAMPFAQEIMRDGYLVDGRWLTAEDDRNVEPVCVIHEKFAKARNLSVGDTLKITMVDERLDNKYYSSETTMDELPTDTLTVSFKIVGIYNRMIYNNNITFHSLYIIIPDSCMPESYDLERTSFQDGSVTEGLYSFLLKSPDLEEEFIRQYRDRLEDMGYTLHMIENGWTSFSAVADPICQSTAYSALIFCVTQIFTLFVVTFLYLRQNRREFAISRALGIPIGKVVLWQIIPITILGVSGIGSGSALGWMYALRQVKTTLDSFENNGRSVQVELPCTVLWILILISIMILLLCVLVCFLRLSHLPVMEILRGSRKQQLVVNKLTGITKEIVEREENIQQPKIQKTIEFDENLGNVNFEKNKAGLMHFVSLHLFRNRGSSILVCAVSIIFIVALGWILQSINQTDRKIDELYQNIIVDAEIMKSNSIIYNSTEKPNYIANTVVNEVLDTGFVMESHLVAPMGGAELSTIGTKNRFKNFVLCGTTDTEILNMKKTAGVTTTLEDYGGEGKITYQDGWDESLFLMDYAKMDGRCPMIVPEAMLKYFGVELGDCLSLSVGSEEIQMLLAGSYTGTFSNVEIIFGKAVLVPLSLTKYLYGEDVYYSNAEFVLDPKKNQELAYFRKVTEEIAANDVKSECDITFRIWDEELRMTAEPMEQNLRLMKILFPIAQLVAMLAGGMVSLLLLLQNAKTAAILRVLGIPAKTVRRMLGAEKLLLGIVGSAAGMLLCAILGKWNMALLVSAALYLLGLLIGTVIGCAAVTRKKPLELLQVKE